MEGCVVVRKHIVVRLVNELMGRKTIFNVLVRFEQSASKEAIKYGILSTIGKRSDIVSEGTSVQMFAPDHLHVRTLNVAVNLDQDCSRSAGILVCLSAAVSRTLAVSLHYICYTS